MNHVGIIIDNWYNIQLRVGGERQHNSNDSRGGDRTVTVIGCMTTNLILVNNHVDWLNVCARVCVCVCMTYRFVIGVNLVIILLV